MSKSKVIKANHEYDKYLDSFPLIAVSRKRTSWLLVVLHVQTRLQLRGTYNFQMGDFFSAFSLFDARISSVHLTASCSSINFSLY